MSTVIVYSPKYLEHNPSYWHPERPERLRVIVRCLQEAGLWEPKVKIIEPKPATLADVRLAHDEEYVSLIERLSKSRTALDADTPLQSNTFELSLLAAGGAITAGEKVMSGEANNAFALVRPPGHHASRSMGGGFCYFNNLAIMIKKLMREFGVKRIFILDFDAHHGNGTQDIFYEDPQVLYMSIHQNGRTLYPGTGFVDEVGAGEGEGYKVNVPIPPGSSDEEYSCIMDEIFVPLSEAFKPELIAVSAGFDAHIDDPLTQLELSTDAYAWLTGYIVRQAEKLCNGRVVLALEGGYNLKALGNGVVNVVKALMGEKSKPPEHGRLAVVDEIKRKLADYWPAFR
jgi:acetoin utilization deacetylase AcuC-like enzyme